MPLIGGTVRLKIDGDPVLVRGNVTHNIGQKVNREGVVGLDGVHGHMERPVVPFVQCDLTERPEFSITKLNEVADATVTVELADGRTLTLEGASQVGDLEGNPEEGSIGSVRFEGLTGTELSS